ncbi:hypothetical protein ZWY2020_049369 [Hordeum vulgare]|nr:hypothetical protein ZWY2020_049369 [Hordeum vulgare]
MHRISSPRTKPPLLLSPPPARSISMTPLRDRITTIAGGDQAKIARLREILSWFDNDWEVSASMKEMVKYLIDSDRDEIYSRDGVRRESVQSIEFLLWAME